MKLSQFDFFLPDEYIASHPLDDRDRSKLMIVDRKNKKIEHKNFPDILNYLSENDILVFNNTKVMPAILRGKKEKTNADIKVFLLRELDQENKLWDVLVSPARKIRIGNKLFFDEGLVAEVIDNTTSRGRTIRFLYDGEYDEFKALLERLGETPLPPFIEREPEPIDKERYQTIFAKHEGAVAAPTAGMHFSKNLLKKLELVGINFAEITLHAGIGNFRAIEVEDLSKHKVDSEKIIINEIAAEKINKALDNNQRVCSVGTTVVKTLESCKTTFNRVAPFEGWTNKFLFPPTQITLPNMMITNFHAPFSSMLMCVAAFAGYHFIMDVYETALKEKYRFGTYGDAMLII